METSLAKWQSLTQHPPVVQFFNGLLERAGVRVADTNEEFTCVHRGDRIEFEPTLDRDRVDFTVEIQSAQVERLAAHAQTGGLDEAEQFRIVSTLFTPATVATLRNPVLAHPWLRVLSGAEDLIHVRLVSPTPQEPDVFHTLVYANRQWLVLAGLHGRPRRFFTLSLPEALTYHRRVFQALKANTFGTWWRFGWWYRGWRKGVSRRV